MRTESVSRTPVAVNGSLVDERIGDFSCPEKDEVNVSQEVVSLYADDKKSALALKHRKDTTRRR